MNTNSEIGPTSRGKWTLETASKMSLNWRQPQTIVKERNGGVLSVMMGDIINDYGYIFIFRTMGANKWQYFKKLVQMK